MLKVMGRDRVMREFEYQFFKDDGKLYVRCMCLRCQSKFQMPKDEHMFANLHGHMCQSKSYVQRIIQKTITQK